MSDPDLRHPLHSTCGGGTGTRTHHHCIPGRPPLKQEGRGQFAYCFARGRRPGSQPRGPSGLDIDLSDIRASGPAGQYRSLNGRPPAHSNFLEEQRNDGNDEVRWSVGSRRRRTTPPPSPALQSEHTLALSLSVCTHCPPYLTKEIPPPPLPCMKCERMAKKKCRQGPEGPGRLTSEHFARL